MSLTMCLDCGTAVSDKAKSCPKCGRSMVYWTFGRIILAVVLGFLVFNFVLYLFGGGIFT